MKRSEINAIMREGVAFIAECRFALPPFAFWTPDEWRRKGPECAPLVERQLGWDITDFGSGAFEKRGLLLFTLRNGYADGRRGLVYCEKIMVVRENQESPLHFHFQKTEDIMVRGGGRLWMQIWVATPTGRRSDRPVVLEQDGCRVEKPAGARWVFEPGESVTLPPYVYHRFWGEPGGGPVLVGEVSRVNDDHKDNRFFEAIGRFPVIEEDEPPWHLLVGDYARWFRPGQRRVTG
jgi:D-lyxose ketol-isomerase